MTHHSRIDWCALSGIAVAVVSILLHASVWIAGPVLLILMLCAFPQSYQITTEGLAVRDALSRRLIPYSEIRHVELSGSRVRVLHGRGSELLMAPQDRDQLFNDLEAELPHLMRVGSELLPRDRYVEYSFRASGGARRVAG